MICLGVICGHSKFSDVWNDLLQKCHEVASYFCKYHVYTFFFVHAVMLALLC